MIGETFGSYKVTGKIGEGGMGAVYLAEHTLLGRKAAVKVLLPEHSRNQDLVNRFFNEAKTAAGLKHPALVDVFDYGVHPSGSAYLVMDFLEGESLGSRLQRVAPLTAEQTAELSRQIARGMEAAHSQGIVHRDLKPDNIFLVPDAEEPTRDQVKILDFGIAKLLGAPSASKGVTSTGMVLGTPLFMAPEQCRGAGVVDHRADIYSLGCIMYLMLCARPPFDYPGVGEILGAHLHEPVPPPRAINPTIPEALEAIVLKALAKKPEDRYQSMAALAAELARLLGLHPSNVGVAAAATGRHPPATMHLPPTPAPGALASAPTTLSKAASPVATPTPPTALPPKKRNLVWPIAGAFLAGGAITAVAVMRPWQPATPSVPDAHAAVIADAARAVAVDAARVIDAAQVIDAAPAVADAATASTADAAVRRKRERRERTSENDGYMRGIALLARGDERGALEAFRSYLRGENLPPARRAEAEHYAISLRRKFGEIEVACEVAGAQVLLDGRPVGRTPLAQTLLLLPGAHELAITKEGYRPLRKSFRISAGEKQPFFFKLPR